MLKLNFAHSATSCAFAWETNTQSCVKFVKMTVDLMFTFINL